MAETGMKWYVLRAVSGKEAKVKEYLEALMKQNDIKFLISIIKKYDLLSMFNSKEEFDEWVNSLSKKLPSMP